MSKYPRTYHLPWSEGAKNDDRIAQDFSSLIGIDIVITEKLDGSNASLTNGGVYGRSHAVYSRNPWDREMWLIHNLVRNDIPEDMFIFGENMEGIHSIEYQNLESYFYIFGVRDNNIWIPWKDVEDWAYLLNLPTVPVLFKGIINSEIEFKKLIEKLSNESSVLGGKREGIVARNASLFHNDDFSENVMKMVRKDHVQTDEHWTMNWKKAKIKR